MELTGVPAELRALKQWIARTADKQPYCAPDRRASSTDPTTWSSLEDAEALVAREGFAGVGFVFSADDPYTGIDLDHCRDPRTGTIHAAAQRVIERFNSYTEVSPSGTGVHIFVRGVLPGKGRKRDSSWGGALEMYDRGRYFTVTGQHIAGTPTTIEERQAAVTDVWTRLGAEPEASPTAAPRGTQPRPTGVDEDRAVVTKALAAKSGDKFDQLYLRGVVDGYPSSSEADGALAALIAHWTRDPAQIERLLRASKLARAKWDEHSDYLQRTITSAIALTEKTHRAGPARRLEGRPFSEIADEEVRWLWPGVIPAGKLMLVVGDPGHGKSFLSLDVAARISRGGTLPDGTKVDAADVVLVFCEDGAGDTVKPRLKAAGADLARVHELRATVGDDMDGLLTLPDDWPAVWDYVEKTHARMLVLDPVNAFLSSKVNSWSDAEVRRALAPCAKGAERLGCSAVGVMHLNKASTANATHRVTGSIAFAGVARSVYLVGPHPEDRDLELREQRRIFAPVKMNLCEPPSSRTFRIEGEPPVIAWGDTTRHSAQDVLGAELTGLAADGKVERTVELLQEVLADGPKPASDVYEIARTRGISASSVKRAKRLLEITTTQEAYNGKNRHVWKLEDGPAPF